MNRKDKYIREKLSKNDEEIPLIVRNKIDDTLNRLPEQKRINSNYLVFKKFALACLAFLFVTIILLPNISVTYAKALENIPVLKEVIKVVTIRNYLYNDDYHEMNISVPKIDGNSEAIDFINADVEELTKYIADKFYEEANDLKDDAHTAVYVDYEVVTDTEKWFTLKLEINTMTGSGNTFFKYYNLNKLTGNIVSLEDIVIDDVFYKVVNEDIKLQMKEQMEDDADLHYWIEDSVFGDDLVSIDSKHNYYFNENYDLVIPFEKYEAAPGYMGTYEFIVDKELIIDYMNQETKGILWE